MSIEQFLIAEYLRNSSKVQQQKGLSLQLQSELNHALIERLGGTFVGTFVDESKSGYHIAAGQRQGIEELKKAVLAGKVNCIVFYDESRLSRQIDDFYRDLYYPIKEINPNVVYYKSSSGEQFFPESETAWANFIQAYRESEKKAAHSKHAQQSLLEKNLRPNSKYGYGIAGVNQHGQLISNKHLPIVLLIFTLASWGYSERAIAKYLNTLEVGSDKTRKQPQQDGRNNEEKAIEWGHTTINYILHNPMYIGCQTWDRRESKHNSSPKQSDQITIYKQTDPIIPKSLWDLAHTELNRRQVKIGGRTNTSFLLSTLLKCNKCGCDLLTRNSTKISGESVKVISKSGNPLKYYFCPECKFRICSETIDKAVLSRMKVELANNVSIVMIEDKIRSWKKVIKQAIKKSEDELDEIKYNAMSLQKNTQFYTDISYVKLQRMITDAELRKRENIQELREAQKQLEDYSEGNIISEMLDRLMCNIEYLSPIERRYIIISAIEHIKVSPAKKEDFKIDLLSYRNFPLPYFSQRFKELIG